MFTFRVRSRQLKPLKMFSIKKNNSEKILEKKYQKEKAPLTMGIIKGAKVYY